jgi:hypothetical protein
VLECVTDGWWLGGVWIFLMTLVHYNGAGKAHDDSTVCAGSLRAYYREQRAITTMQ